MVQNHKTVIWNFDFFNNPPDGYLLAFQASTGLWIPVNVPLGINRKIGATITSGPYLVLAGDDFIPVDSTSGPITINLPAAPVQGKGYTIADITGHAAANNITISGNGFQIAGSPTVLLNTNYQELTAIFNGTNWTKV
jgi:hypothetical protein